MLDLFTCSYGEYRPRMGVAVRTTAGAPPGWFTAANETAHAKLVTPRWSFLRKPKAAYEPEYLAMLDGHGVQAVADELLGITQMNGDHRLVLLCFDDLRQPSGWCHRTMFARWWTENTGDPCREVGGSWEKNGGHAL